MIIHIARCSKWAAPGYEAIPAATLTWDLLIL